MRHTFAALSVFAGPFGVPDAAAVCGLDRSAAEGALAELTERSLVMRIPEHGFLLLETLRAYGAEQLAASGGEGDARRRHARHFVDWATEADRRLMDPGHGSNGAIDARGPELQRRPANLLAHDEGEKARPR